MKLSHTPLGAMLSKKKVIAGALALALVGGIAPTFIKNSNALETDPYYDPDETVFAVVGPDYYSTFSDRLSSYVYDGYHYYIEDTSVADFGEYCSTCIMGKKIGETEIIFEKNGEETVRMPLVSVELMPERINTIKAGGTISVTGSLKGASDELLHVVTWDNIYGVYVRQTGERSLVVDTTAIQQSTVFEVLWGIGDQEIQDWTRYYIEPVAGIDNIYNLPENEDILENAALNIKQIINERFRYEPMSNIIETDDGSIFYSERQLAPFSGIPVKTQAVLDFDDANITTSAKSELKANLPEGARGVAFKRIKASVGEYREEGGGAVANAAMASTKAFMPAPVVQPDDNNLFYVSLGYFEFLADPLTMTIDVSDAKEVKDGYTRKWYVVRDNNGKIEDVDAIYDESTETLRFATNIFGNFAYGYIDEKIEEEKVTPAPKVPNTGVAQKQIATTAAVTILPLLGISAIAFMIRSKKRNDSKLARKHNHFE